MTEKGTRDMATDYKDVDGANGDCTAEAVNATVDAMTDTETLKPCPFCGSEAESGNYARNPNGEQLYGVWCKNCPARMWSLEQENVQRLRWNTRNEQNGARDD